jgi:hypothetical protein
LRNDRWRVVEAGELLDRGDDELRVEGVIPLDHLT